MLAAARALSRAGLPPTPHLDLPVATEPQEKDEVEVDQGIEADAPAGIAQDEVGEDVEMVEETGEEQVELLSMAESLVLPYSLTQTRQYHLTHLLPHIFSHPVVPSYNRPRLRIPPRTGLLGTPLPELPLPLDEYHANNKAEPSTPSATPDGKGKDKSDVPAHEAQCIARVELSLGPISFPSTELWIGRFVHPRASAPRKAPLTKEEKAERDRIRKQQKKLDDQKPLARPLGRPSTTAGPSRPPAAPVRPGIDPALIQRVNAAAAQHPWLSAIIHKAARNSASKEELAKLARIVARLGRGEGIGEGPSFGLVPVRPSATLSPAPQGSLATSGSELSSVPSDSDSEPDMTGPKQVGGGPTDQSSMPPASAATTATAQTTAPAFRPYQASSGTSLPTPPLVRPPLPATGQPSRPFPQYPPGASAAPAASSPSPQTTVPTTPVPPRRYPLPAPFLYIAFRELPTEKYLVPIGSQSYISRVGGDHVTHPAPSPSAKPAPPAPASVSTQEPVPAVDTTPGEISKRTRQSLGRQKEDKPPTPEPEPERLPTPPPEIPKSNLPPVPGMTPPPGTVLISTFVPTSDWMQPDWKSMSKRLPFENTIFDIVNRAPVETKPEPNPHETRHHEAKSGRPAMLNLGAEAWFPDDDPVHAVTFRLQGLDDRAWARMKQAVSAAEQAEANGLAEQQPDLIAPGGRDRASQPRLWETYYANKRSTFESLLTRVPSRAFLQYRLAEKSSDIIDASADRWGPRPYPMSTRPLYLTSPPPEGEPLWDMPLPQAKRRRNEPEVEVEFEMPVSLDQLDERVAVGALKAVNRKVGKLKMPKRRPPKPVINEADENAGTRFQKRGAPGKICQGCAKEGLKVWRRGPGGPGTLCNGCGSKYLDGTLGPLQAPAVSAPRAQPETTEVKMEVDGPDAPQQTSNAPEPEGTSNPIPESQLIDSPAVTTPLPVVASDPSSALPAAPIAQSDPVDVVTAEMPIDAPSDAHSQVAPASNDA